jgi:cell wall-associated protease
MIKKVVAAFIACSFSLTLLAQEKTDTKGWHLKDKTDDGFQGISLQKAYDLLRDKTSKRVIVAVIDGGIDTTHEDLKPVLWKNEREIAGNGKDDDGNGYIDDVYGWNFCGGKDGNNVGEDSQEEMRIYHQYKSKFEGVEVMDSKLTAIEKNIYKEWKRAKAKLTLSDEEIENINQLSVIFKALKKADSTLQVDMERKMFTVDTLEIYSKLTDAGKRAKMAYLTIAKQMLQVDGDTKNSDLVHDLDEYITSKQKIIDAKDNPPANFRGMVTKDKYSDFNDKYYGNGDVMAGTPTHGTHVSGIIAAVRGNGIGMDGVADNVSIMTLRAVPKGDEHDKDVALAIRYAVDNGATIINMSFGKDFSPERKWVEEAIRYAESKDVLLVHAAGNDGKDLDKEYNYPTDLYVDGKRASNMLTVGASSDVPVSNGLIANFSNYGKGSVDIFAPGKKIYSTIPHGKEYKDEDGTSMASPVTAGLAALLRSYFPSLTAQQIKQCIVESVDRTMDKTKVEKPGEKDKKVLMNSLSRFGGIINAATAVQNAINLQAAAQNKKKPVTIKVKKAKKG